MEFVWWNYQEDRERTYAANPGPFIDLILMSEAHTRGHVTLLRPWHVLFGAVTFTHEFTATVSFAADLSLAHQRGHVWTVLIIALVGTCSDLHPCHEVRVPP